MDVRSDRNVQPPHSLVHGAKVKDTAYISHVEDVLEKGESGNDEVVTWAGFSSQLMDNESVKPPAKIGILLLFPDKAASPSMMKHTMEIVKKNTEFVHPGQTPVLGADQPLYAI